jgi:uncharacterized membrane protein
MNWPHLHLMLNHIPVLGTVFGLALLGWAVVRRHEPMQRIALATFVIAALAAIPVYLTGGPAEEVVEHLAGTAEQAIEAHEEGALLAFIAIELLGCIALAAIVFRTARFARALTRAVLAMSLVTAGLMARTANLGGAIRHAELRGEAVPPEAEEQR